VGYGGGRADVRPVLIDEELYVLSKSDGMIRAIVAVPEPTSVIGVGMVGLFLASRRRRR
jgi:hypothetical protein